MVESVPSSVADTIQGILTDISNGRTEGYNRIVKHVGRGTFSFRNTENQKRRDTIRLHPRITPGANQNPQAPLILKSRQKYSPDHTPPPAPRRPPTLRVRIEKA